MGKGMQGDRSSAMQRGVDEVRMNSEREGLRIQGEIRRWIHLQSDAKSPGVVVQSRECVSKRNERTLNSIPS